MTRRTHPLAALRWAIDAALVAIVALVVIGLVVARALPAMGHETITITGSSMEPALPLGSVVVLERTDPDRIRVGQVVSIRVPERGITYTHRVVEVVQRPDGPYLRTRGDNDPSDDPVLVPASWAIGVVEGTIPGLGYLLRLLATVPGISMAIGLAVTLYVGARLIEDLERDAAADRRRAASPPGAGRLPGTPETNRP